VEPIRITILYDLNRLSPNVRVSHPYEFRRRKRDAQLATRAAWRKAGEPRSEVPVRVNLIVRRAASTDAINRLAAYKWIEDALFNARRCNGEGITPDDSPVWVEIGTCREEIDRCWRGREELGVEVWPREQEPSP
jgi:hypothetical protein